MTARSLVWAVSFAMALAVAGADAQASGTAAGNARPAGTGPVETVATAGLNGAHVGAVVNGHGTVTAVWAEREATPGGGTLFRVRAARRSASGHWTRPRTVGCPTSDACSPTWPSIGIDGSGRVTVVWPEGSRLVSSQRPPDGPWTAPRVIARDSSFIPPMSVSLDVAPTGAAAVAWDVNDELLPVTPVRVMRRPPGGTWGTRVLLDRGYPSQVAVAASGVTIVVQQYKAHASARVFEPGRGWGAQHRLSRLPGEYLAATFGNRGHALVVWSQARRVGRPLRIYGEDRTPEGVWTRPFRISPPVGTGHRVDDYWGQPVIDSHGRETVAFIRSVTGGSLTGMVATRRAAGSWQVTTFPRVHGYRVHLLVNRSDDLALAFHDRTSLHRPDHPWRTASGGGSIALLASGDVVRLWWDHLTLRAQLVTWR